MINNLKAIEKEFEAKIKGVTDEKTLEQMKKEFLGKDSVIAQAGMHMKSASVEEKKEIGKLSNILKAKFMRHFDELTHKFKTFELNKRLEGEKIDLSIPGVKLDFYNKHPLNLVIDEIYTIFSELGFDLVDGTELETDEYCFQKLNLPIGHPARDMQDTFYINEKLVLRTHCTNMTARALTEAAKNLTTNSYVSSVSYGNVYRRDDDDATHSHQFMQIDGFALGDKISFANLRWVLDYMCKRLFGEATKIRMRPSYFPFTEPSVEVDITCVTCKGAGCNICKQTGFVEILGAGMISPKVLTLNNIDPEQKTGLAFGIGVERIAMLKYGIKNIRDFYENDVRFLKQFKFFGE
jgi:phenylalanyl-tRNA synthetase alpha chain